MIDIKGLDRASVLAALYNHSRPQGMGFLHSNKENMTVEQAREILSDPSRAIEDGRGRRALYFDYLNGRVMKVDIDESVDELDERLYDRDNGQGAALHALKSAGLIK